MGSGTRVLYDCGGHGMMAPLLAALQAYQSRPKQNSAGGHSPAMLDKIEGTCLLTDAFIPANAASQRRGKQNRQDTLASWPAGA